MNGMKGKRGEIIALLTRSRPVVSSNSWWAVLFLLSLGTLSFFFPFFFEGEHAVPFSLERSASTAIPHGSPGARAANQFPKDNSPAVHHYPNAALVAQSLRRGELPTWDPYNGCGKPALGGGQVYPFSPFLWPFYAWPNPWVYTLGFVLGCLWAGIGLTLWLRKFLSGWYLGLAVVFGVFNPWTARCLGFTNTWADWWIGWLLWSWHLAIEKGSRWWWVPVLPMTGTVYCGHPESAFLLAVIGGIYGLFVWAATERRGRIGWRTFMGRVAAMGALTVLLTGAHWAPLAAHLPETVSYKFHGAQNVTALAYGTSQIFNPNTDVFFSPVFFALALLGAVELAPKRQSWLVLSLHGITWVVAFGLVPRGLQGLLTLWGTLPGIYARGLFWTTLAALAAAGARALGQQKGPQLWRAGRLFALGLSAYAVLFWADYQRFNLAYLLLRKDLLWYDLTAALFMSLAVLGSSGLLRKSSLVVGVSLVVLGPLAIQRWAYPYFNSLDPLEGGPPAIAQFEKLNGATHARFFGGNEGNPERSDLEPNLATLWRVRDMRINSPLFLARYAQLQEMLRARKPGTMDTWLTFDKISPPQLGLFGVSYQAKLLEEEAAKFQWRPVKDALPRAYLVHHVWAARDEDQARIWFARWARQFPGGPLKDSVLLEGWRGTATVGDGGDHETVEWLEDGLKTVRLRITSSSGGVLVLLDTYADGWKAALDGRAVPIYAANVAFRAVAVPAGIHEVSFRYAPSSVAIGAGLSVAGWLGVLCLIGVSWRKRTSR